MDANQEDQTMSMYIDTAYPDVTQDERLTSLVKELTALSIQIQDGEWEGQDVTASKQMFNRLKAMHDDGITYQPLF